MISRKIFIIIPGFGESDKDYPYPEIKKVAQESGFKVINFNPVWDRNTTDIWLKDLKILLSKYKESEVTILGFSLGGYLALLSSDFSDIRKMIICSPSPFFADDIPHLPLSINKFFGIRRVNSFLKYKTPNKISVPVSFFIGSEDLPYAVEKVKKLAESLSNKNTLEVLPNIGHDLEDDRYLKAVIQKIKTL